MATFYNQATLSYNGSVTNSNIATGELLEVLSVSKTAVMDDYNAHGSVTYVINIVNSGASAFNNLTVTDDLGAYALGAGTFVPLTYRAGSVRYYVGGILQAAPTVTAEPSLVISGLKVPPGSNAAILYEATPNQYAPLGVGSSIVNTAVVSGDNITPITAEETVTAEETAVLTISKSISPSTVTENSQVTYTFVIQNSGNTAAGTEDGIVITDTFNPVLDSISILFNGAPWSSPGNYTYNTVTGEFATVSGQITVPAATYIQDAVTGVWIVNPGVSILTVTGTI